MTQLQPLIILLAILLGVRGGPPLIIASTIVDKGPPEKMDCGAGGKMGNPGAQIRFSTEALDAVYKHGIAYLSQSIKTMTLPYFVVPLGAASLTIKNARVVQAQIGGFQREMIPKNTVIKSCLYGGKIVSIGEWSYRPPGGVDQRQLASGIFRTVVINPKFNITKRLIRLYDATAALDVIECKAEFKQFRVEIEGFNENTTVIESCDHPLCDHVRNAFQTEVCNRAKTYIADFANKKMKTFPVKINLGPTSSGNRFVMDYGLLIHEPKVTVDGDVRGDLRGEVLSRGVTEANFDAVTLFNFDNETNDQPSMVTFKLGDYAFNTLFHHAHAQQFKFSAYDLVPQTSHVRDYLKMRCQSSSSVRSNLALKNRPSQRQGASTPKPKPPASPTCLGELFDKNDNSSSEENVDGLGDIVFKTQRPWQVLLDGPFLMGVDGGTIEAYGAARRGDGKRELLGKADVQWVRGSFLPKLKGCNITGTVSIYQMRLTNSTTSPIAARFRQMPESMLDKLAQLCVPIFTEALRSFLDQYAQFPIPLYEGLECQSPEIKFTANRTMQIHSQIRALPEATRVGGKTF